MQNIYSDDNTRAGIDLFLISREILSYTSELENILIEVCKKGGVSSSEIKKYEKCFAKRRITSVDQ
ncbi:MAG: hypothetical protein VX645_02455, partial [Pseudomonadota bacterium]|nr:hypothetical protein [Pseudomonadota bacterium]